MSDKVRRVIISGFDYVKTEALARRLEEIYGMKECSIIYVPEEKYREDRMTAHMVASNGADGSIFRYIRRHEADVLYAGSDYDACRNFAWISPRGTILVENTDSSGANPRFPAEAAEKYLKAQAEMGYVRTLIHCKSILADV